MSLVMCNNVTCHVTCRLIDVSIVLINKINKIHKSIIELNLFEVLVGIGCYFYSHNLAVIKMVTQGNKAEAIRFYDYCLTNANVILFLKSL